MHLVVTVASRHGSTRVIADAIANEIRTAGHSADVADAGKVTSLDPYDAVVIGSAVYMGRWLADARDLVRRHESRLAAMPVWLFSSGPLGDQPASEADPAVPLAQQLHARGYRVFAGRLDEHEVGPGERLVVRVVKAPYGDFRDWDNIRAWARDIAAALQPADVGV